MDKKEIYREKMDARMKELNAKIDELKARAQKSKADAKLEYTKGVDALEEKRDELKKNIKEWNEAGEQSAEDLRQGIEEAFFDLKEALKSATARFQKEK